eukprot:5681659-Pleurochrysis_carterae.AAC.2
MVCMKSVDTSTKNSSSFLDTYPAVVLELLEVDEKLQRLQILEFDKSTKIDDVPALQYSSPDVLDQLKRDL